MWASESSKPTAARCYKSNCLFPCKHHAPLPVLVPNENPRAGGRMSPYGVQWTVTCGNADCRCLSLSRPAHIHTINEILRCCAHTHTIAHAHARQRTSYGIWPITRTHTHTHAHAYADTHTHHTRARILTDSHTQYAWVPGALKHART